MSKKQIGGRTPHYAGGGPGETRTSPAPAARVAPSQPATPIQVRGELVQVGHSLAFDAIRRRDWKPLNQATADANSGDLTLRQAGLSVLFGAACSMSGLLRGIAKQGALKINGHVPTVEEITYALSTDVRRFNVLLKTCVDTMNILMDKAPQLCAAIPEHRSEAAEPQAVRVISMPARSSATNIRRNQNGDIVSTTQFEQDA